MFSRLTNKNSWVKVLAASLSTSLIIFISFIIRNFIKTKRKSNKSDKNTKNNKKSKYIEPKYLALEFVLIFLSSFISYVIVYIVLDLNL